MISSPLFSGFKISLRPSARRLKLSMARAKAREGQRMSHHALRIFSNPNLRIVPQEAVGGGTPRPRNDSPASAMIMKGIYIPVMIRTGPMIFGRICLNRIVLFPDPRIIADSTKGSLMTERAMALAVLPRREE